MDIPVDLSFPAELAVLVRKQALGDNRCNHDVDESVCEKRTEYFMDMKREGSEPEVIGERLYSLTEPWQWWDRERILHDQEGKGEGSRWRYYTI
jgi:hypothetical protein